MDQLSEIESRVLGELQEAGEETPATILNTIADTTGDAQELSDFVGALSSLVRLGLIEMATQRDDARRLAGGGQDASLAAVDTTASVLKFDTRRRMWADSRRVGPPFEETFPYVVITENGNRAALAVLRERGYQWWRQR